MGGIATGRTKLTALQLRAAAARTKDARASRRMLVIALEGTDRAIVLMFLSVPPHIALSPVIQKIKGRSSRHIQIEVSELRKRYWGRGFGPVEIFDDLRKCHRRPTIQHRDVTQLDNASPPHCPLFLYLLFNGHQTL